MCFLSILGGLLKVMANGEEKMMLGKRIGWKSWLFLKLEAIFVFYNMIFISKRGHAKSMNIDLKIENLSYLSPNHHNIVRQKIDLLILGKTNTLMFM